MKIIFRAMHLISLMRKPAINYTKKRKITIKHRGVWGEKVHKST